MTPTTPERRRGMVPVVIAGDQEDYQPLPANVDGVEVETKWQLTLRERLRLLWTGSLYLRVFTFGRPLQPLLITVDRAADVEAAA